MRFLTKEKIFIFASCTEIGMALVEMCQYDFCIRRFLLWGFFAIYLWVASAGHYSSREKLFLIICMIIGIPLYLSSGINTGIKAPIYIFALREIDRSKLFKWMLATMILVMIGIMVMSFFGFGSFYISDYRKNGFFHGIRYSLGFSNPNVLQFFTFAVLSYFLLLFGKKMTIKQYFYLIIGYFCIFVLTYSKTGLVVGMFIWLLALTLRWSKWKYWNILIGLAYAISFILFMLFSLLAAAKIRGGIIEVVNDFISGRMDQLWHYTNDTQYPLPYMDSWHLFSSKLNKNVYDMGYIQTFYYYGIIPAVLYFAYILYTAYRAVAQRKVFGILVLWGFSIYLFMESLYFTSYMISDFLLMSTSFVLWETYYEGKGKEPLGIG